MVSTNAISTNAVSTNAIFFSLVSVVLWTKIGIRSKMCSLIFWANRNRLLSNNWSNTVICSANLANLANLDPILGKLNYLYIPTLPCSPDPSTKSEIPNFNFHAFFYQYIFVFVFGRSILIC